MFNARKYFLSFCLLTYCINTHGADKYTDENRPYEFGFNIEGEQHRHEKKDENGLIMGEFGFITADGVYHVTVYATDENGNFKILSMKNIRVKPYPTTSAKQGHSIKFPPSQPGDIPPPPPPQQNNPPPPIDVEPSSPAKSCSHCSIPTTTTRKPFVAVAPNQHQLAPFDNQQPNVNGEQNSYYNPNDYQQNSQQPFDQSTFNNANNYGDNPTYPQTGFQDNEYNQRNPKQYNIDNNYNSQQQFNPENRDGDLKQYNENNYYNPEQQLNPGNEIGQQQSNPQDVSAFTRLSDETQGGPINKPMLISAQMQIVDKNTDIYSRGPGENEGLPTGLTKDDMSTLLYTFNYTVGFHGHHEEGYTNGVKKGYYYVTGRNGVRTRVDYTADETGFHPKISQEVLDLLSEDVPKPETERDEKYGLKGYEFKWLYYPSDSKR